MTIKNKIIVAIVCLLALPCLFFVVKNKIHMKRVRTFAKEEKFALAKHELEQVTCLKPKSFEDCRLIMDVYLKNYDFFNVDYFAELCEKKGFKDKNVVLYKSKIRELRGDLAAAVNVIGVEISSGSGSGSAATDPEYYFVVAQLLTRMNNTQGAVASYVNVYKLAGDSLELKFKALGALVDLKANEQALMVAKNFATQTFSQPVPYFLLARVLFQLKDVADAKVAYDKGLPLLAGLDEKVRAQITQNFQDVIQALGEQKANLPKK